VAVSAAGRGCSCSKWLLLGLLNCLSISGSQQKQRKVLLSVWQDIRCQVEAPYISKTSILSSSE
jgi:hypothetical protein